MCRLRYSVSAPRQGSRGRAEGKHTTRSAMDEETPSIVELPLFLAVILRFHVSPFQFRRASRLLQLTTYLVPGTTPVCLLVVGLRSALSPLSNFFVFYIQTVKMGSNGTSPKTSTLVSDVRPSCCSRLKPSNHGNSKRSSRRLPFIPPR